MSSIEERKKNEPIFKEFTAHDDDDCSGSEISTIESLCMNCGENGLTKLLLTKIPYYKEIILMSFECKNCGFQNNEIQSGGKINEKGIKINVKISNASDLNRQVIKSDYTSIKIPKLDFEIPAQSQKGEITTIEGIIDKTVLDLEQDQSKRREDNPEIADQIDLFISKLNSLKTLGVNDNDDESFTMIFEDITGETYVENLNAPKKDLKCFTTYFIRSESENKLLGIYKENHDELLNDTAELSSTGSSNYNSKNFTLEDLEGEILKFPTNCPVCNAPCTTNMKMTKIPHFKEVIIMATTCDTCGHRTNEVKSGSGIEPEGLKIEIKVRGKEDFSRDVLKSENCSMQIPELDLEVGPGALGGRFTTVEGILMATKEQLMSNPICHGDSSEDSIKKRMNEFISNFDKILNGEFSNTNNEQEITIIFDDPTGNSYVQSLSDNGCDERLKISKYQRTVEQNEELGLNDMKIENY